MQLTPHNTVPRELKTKWY